MEKLVYDGSTSMKMRIFNEYSKGNLSVTCPQCKEEIIVVLSESDVKTHEKARGLYCPNDHFWTVFNFR